MRLVGFSLFAGALALTLLVLGGIVDLPGAADVASPTAFAAREARKVKAAYTDWRSGEGNVTISLGYVRSRSTQYTQASGTARVDPTGGSVSVTISGLPAGEAWDVWLVDNARSTHRGVWVEPGDSVLRLGRLASTEGQAVLQADLGPAAFRDFHVDVVVVTRAGGHPATDGLLFGTPTLTQRL